MPNLLSPPLALTRISPSNATARSASPALAAASIARLYVYADRPASYLSSSSFRDETAPPPSFPFFLATAAASTSPISSRASLAIRILPQARRAWFRH